MTNTSTTKQQLTNPERYRDPIIKNLVAFISAHEFQAEFESFFMRHCRTFCNEEEQRLEYNEIYLSFQNLFEGRIEQVRELCR